MTNDKVLKRIKTTKKLLLLLYVMFPFVGWLLLLVKEQGRRRKNELCKLAFFPINCSAWKDKMCENSGSGEFIR